MKIIKLSSFGAGHLGKNNLESKTEELPCEFFTFCAYRTNDDKCTQDTICRAKKLYADLGEDYNQLGVGA